MAHNKTIWRNDQVLFLESSWQQMTAQQLADALGLKRTTVRTKLYEMGLKKIEMEYWTPEQITCLKRNYRTLGDTELAEIFNRRWAKQKGWHKKHIEKKRKQMGLRRTKREIAYIRRRNIEKGRFKDCPLKRWKLETAAAEREVRIWRFNDGFRAYIKIRGKFIPYAPWYYREHIGPVPRGYIVRVKNGDQTNICKENLELVTRGQNGPMNSRQSLEYKREKQKSILRQQIIRNEKQIIRLEQSLV